MDQVQEVGSWLVVIIIVVVVPRSDENVAIVSEGRIGGGRGTTVTSWLLPLAIMALQERTRIHLEILMSPALTAPAPVAALNSLAHKDSLPILAVA